MKKNLTHYFFSVFLLMLSAIGISAQTTNPTPVPTPAQTPVPTPVPTPAIQPNRQLRNSIEDLLMREELRRKQEQYKLAQRIIQELYRNPTKKELQTVEIDQDLSSRYSNFLKQDKTGLIRLLSDAECAKSSTVVSVSDECLKRTMPGAGSSFSFRKDTYRLPHLADISFSEEKFFISGDWLHGIITSVGDVPLEKVDLQTSGLKYLTDFQPAFEYESAKKIDYKLTNGVKNGQFLYSRSATVRENTTYLLRSIAYRGIVRKSAEGFIYNELDYDKRKDIIVAFRVVRRHSDGSVTILWKQISSKDSPKILRNSDKDDTKIKQNDYVAKGKK